MKNKTLRLAKLMSQRNICSRREAESFIENRQVLVDGKIVIKQGSKVSENVEIKLLSKAQKSLENKVTIIMNKPIGIVSSQPEKGYLAAIDLINKENQVQLRNKKRFYPTCRKKLAVAGRLDIDSKGLLVLTQDGVVAKQLIGSGNIEKEYLVYVDGEITYEKIKKLSYGLSLDGKILKRAKVKQIKKNLLNFILNEGRNRQIRKMCQLVDLKVIGLKRIRIGKVCLNDLPEGKWRFLSLYETF